MNIKPTASIKVTEMSDIHSIDDNSVLLVVQNGQGHKISFADLKKSIIQEIQQEILDNTKQISELEQKQQNLKNELNLSFQKQMDEFSDNVVTSAKNSLERLKAQIQGNIQRYHAVAEQKFDRFKDDIDADNIPKLFSKNTDLARKLTRLENSMTTKINQLSTDISQSQSNLIFNNKLNIERLNHEIVTSNQTQIDLSTSFSDINTAFNEKINKLSAELNEQCSILSSQLEEFDVNLFGLTVQDVDLDTAKVRSSKVKVGELELLSSRLEQLEQKFDEKFVSNK